MKKQSLINTPELRKKLRPAWKEVNTAEMAEVLILLTDYGS